MDQIETTSGLWNSSTTAYNTTDPNSDLNSTQPPATTDPDSNSTRPPPPLLDLNDLLMGILEYRLSRYLGIYGYPVLILLGTVGNVLSLVVMTRRTMIGSSTCFYMAVLSVADTILLYFGCLRTWFSYLTGYDAIILSPAACKIFSFLTYFSYDFAAWVLVAMTIERFIAIHFPFKKARYTTVSRAKKVVAFLTVMFAGINVHFFFTITVTSKGYCNPLPEYRYFNDKVFPWIDATLYSFLPFVLLLLFNIIIIYDNRKASFRQVGLQATTGQRLSLAQIRFNRRLTAMLLSVSLAFLVTTAPKAVIIIIEPYTFVFFDGPSIDFQTIAKYTLTKAVMNFLTFGTHAINFLLYCISGQRFRRELRRICVNCLSRKSAQPTVVCEMSRRFSASLNISVQINMESVTNGYSNERCSTTM